MTQEISIFLAFIAGFLSFLSPCVLPIIPGFISYIAGKSFHDLKKMKRLDNHYLIKQVSLFILGFIKSADCSSVSIKSLAKLILLMPSSIDLLVIAII